MAHDYRAVRTFESLLRRAGRANQASQVWLGEFGPRDKGSFCLPAVGMAADQERCWRKLPPFHRSPSVVAEKTGGPAAKAITIAR